MTASLFPSAFFTPFTNSETPSVPGLYLTQRRMSRNSRNLCTLMFWDGARWVLSGKPNIPNVPYAPGPNGRVNQHRYWCGLAFDARLLGGSYSPAVEQALARREAPASAALPA